MSEEALLAELRAWLDVVELPAGLRDWGLTAASDDLLAARAWQRLLHDGGWACIGWPVEFGGRGAGAVEEAAFVEELARRGLPRQISVGGPDVAGPLLIRHGTDDQRARLLPAIRSGDHIWCQLWSESEAGSDLSNVRTRAHPVEGGWRLNGHKLWASAAQIADYGLLLARTGADEPRQGGLTLFALPMDRPGITLAPIRQLDRDAKFNEVFLEDVPLTTTDVIGDVDDGWRLLGSVVGRERLTIGAQAAAFHRTLAEFVDSRADREEPIPAVLRQQLADAWIHATLLGLSFRRILAGAAGIADPRLSAVKLLATELQRRIALLAGPVWGAGLVAGEQPEAAQRLLAACGATIAGGTSEVQRNILAERVLGLPREPRPRPE